jgi:hypothetical protein
VKAGKLDLVVRVSLRGNDFTTFDLCSLSRNPKQVARLYSNSAAGILLMLIDFFAVPRALSSQLIDKIRKRLLCYNTFLILV